MCGIFGISGVVDQESLVSSIPLLQHRGPDDNGLFVDHRKGIALSHTRLSILDTSSLGHQPMISADGRVIIVFNGEIYNYVELRHSLLDLGYVFKGQSDTEVLLSLYLEHRSCPDKLKFLRLLNGIFSFAIYDSDLNLTLIARDALGVKPLYYRQIEDSFYFSSEIKALPLESLSIDYGSIDRYLTHLWSPGPSTPVREIKKLGPGQALILSSGRILDHLAWYCLPGASSKKPTITARQLSSRESIHGTATKLRQAVHRQMVSDVPVGAFLSGGLDSSSVVAFARELNPSIRCFTIDCSSSSAEGFAPDLPFAQSVARHLDVPLDVVQIDPIRMASDLPALVAQLDEPLADPAALNVLYISRLASEQGIKVLLSGVGGDDLFSGYRRHSALAHEWLWTWMPSFIRQSFASLATHLDHDIPFFRRLSKLSSSISLDGDQRLLHYFNWINRADLDVLLSPPFREYLALNREPSPMQLFLDDLPTGLSPLERMLLLEQRFFLADHNLVYTDKMSMAAGVEVRVPFLDLDLVEFSARIPSRYKHRGRHAKWVLKKAMEPYLPGHVIYRSKCGFSMPLRRWLRYELREWLSELLSFHRLSKRGLFDPQAVHRLIASNDEGRVDASYTLLSLACIEIWCCEFLDCPPFRSTSQL